MSRYAVRIFKAAALVLSVALAACPALAAQRASYVFDGKTVTFERVVDEQGGRAVGIDDPGVRALLERLAATVTWQPDQRYILVTTAQPEVISFALGDRRYDVGPVTQTAPFAPFLLDGEAFVPLDELLHGLGLAAKTQGTQQVLQPQITSLDVQQPAGGGAKVIARGALPLDGTILAQGNGKIVVAFAETGSALPPSRVVDGGPVRRIDSVTSGSALHPRTTLTLYTSSDGGRAVAATDDGRDFTLALASGGAGATPAASPSQQAAGIVHVTAAQMQNEGGGFTLHVAVDGAAPFEWHRLRPPDNRVWIDVHGARLGMPPTDTPVRVHQQNTDTVRIAVSLAAYQTIQVAGDEQGVTLTVGSQLARDDAPRAGSGMTGTAPSVAALAQPRVSPGTWKFSPRSSPGATYVPANPRLIVIDPGHGGSDPGAARGDATEKTLALDMAKRVRDILLRRGWQVMMTREDDRDVYAPNDSAADELQARDDVANNNGARLFLSIHVNSFINSGPHGATVYYYKPEDYSLAQALNRRIAAHVAVKDDGTVKDMLYVLHHADMPAALVETAYVSNPDDRALLQTPAWRQSIAQAIADAIGDYAGPPPAAGQSPGQ
ncbi:MAG: N-acetylmuramoyl-L-alanine amidase [Candidatus Baltobacteraceae bacterium]